MPRTSKKVFEMDDSFYRLASEVTKVLEDNKADNTTQKEQVEELLLAEKKFKENIVKHHGLSTKVYKRFLQKICVENKNILSARPYFRETAITFSKQITPCIKTTNIEELKKFHINYQFIKFIRDTWIGPFPKTAEALYQRVHKARTKLIQNNIPLAINRAKLFYNKTPKSHLSLMDMIGVCAIGLASGVDKWVGEYSTVFRSVIIGRCVGLLIDIYSETMLHLYPSDKRILYKANSIRGRQGITEVKELADAVNKSFLQDEKEGKSIPKGEVTESQLSELLNGASIASADATMDDEGYGVYQLTPDLLPDMESVMIEQESTSSMTEHARKLPILHRKVLRLKGIKL